MAMVCSKWADSEPSAVTTPHPSSSTLVLCVPTLTMGSMANTMPGFSFGPFARVAVVRDTRLLVHGGADGVTFVPTHDRVTGVFRDHLHGVADVGQAVAVDHLRDRRVEGRLGHVHQPLRLGVDLADAGGERGIAVPALDDRAAVDADDVAVLQAIRAGDAVHDHVVGRRADDRGEAVIIQEVRLRATPIEHVARHAIEVECGDARTNRRAHRVVHLGHHASGGAHLLQLVARLAHGCRGHPTTPPRPRVSIDPTIRLVT